MITSRLSMLSLGAVLVAGAFPADGSAASGGSFATYRAPRTVMLNPQPIPPGRGSWASLNPQPIPPGRGITGALNPQPIPPGRGITGALNPQPIPPGRSVSVPVMTGSAGGVPAFSGTRPQIDPPPVQNRGAAQALNPQPIPPGRGVTGALNPQPIPPGRAVTGPAAGGAGAAPMAGGTRPQIDPAPVQFRGAVVLGR